MVAKSSPMKKTAAWKKVPYNRNTEPARFRRSRAKWVRNLSDLLQATDKESIAMCQKDGTVPDWKGMVCPVCAEGEMGPLRKATEAVHPLKHRCSAKGCQAYINPHHAHPILVDARGQSASSLQQQTATMFCALAGVPQAACHILIGGNDKAISRIYKNLRLAQKRDVIREEKKIVIGEGKPWQDVEADEAMFRRKTLKGAELKKARGLHGFSASGKRKRGNVKNTEWEQWLGLVMRGKPKTLILSRLPSKLTTKRAPGPGPIKKLDWAPLAKKHMEGKKVVFHTDSAKAYKLRVRNVLHDRVVHKKKKIIVKGKTFWTKPKYVQLKSHKLPGGKSLKVKTGTQVIDRCWRFLKERLHDVHAPPGSIDLKTGIRSAQWFYWHRDADLWLETGAMLRRLRG
jgi:hypothetical protein